MSPSGLYQQAFGVHLHTQNVPALHHTGRESFTAQKWELCAVIEHSPYLLTIPRNLYVQLFMTLTVKKRGQKKGQMKLFSAQKLSRYRVGKMGFYPWMYFSPPCRWQYLYQGMGVLREGDEVQSSRIFPGFLELQRDQRKLDMNCLFWLTLVIRQGPGGSCMS